MHIALGLQWRKLANRKIKQINALVQAGARTEAEISS
jgi:hypothetical protein